MARNPFSNLVLLSVFATAFVASGVSAMELQSVEFPEKRAVELPIVNRPIAPDARVRAEVVHKQGQARIEMSYESMKPAILFGGDITCFVVWAVTRDGNVENLGELLTSKSSGRLTFRTGKKSFALVVTAESYYLVNRPSELVVFRNVAPVGQSELASSFEFDGFAPAPRHSMDGIAHIKWDSKVPLELLQARKAFELATRFEATVHAPEIHAEAETALNAANEIARSTSRGRELLDASRRAVALSNEALNISMHRIEAIEIEKEIARRREETAALERRAAEAETAAREAQKLATLVREEAERARAEKERMVAETTALRTEQAALQTAMVQMRQEKSQLEGESLRLRGEKTALETEALRLRQDKELLQQESQRLEQEKLALMQQAETLRQDKLALEQESEKLRREKAEIAGRLESALSHVADTTDTARGFVVNLPDILFDVNEATLKVEARMVLAKLSGILLIMPEQEVLIEGHTDSTGSAEYNLDLSQRRASAVLALLRSQGLDASRLSAVGFGMEQPVADNSTAEGRKRNRRVEIIISTSDTRTMASN